MTNLLSQLDDVVGTQHVLTGSDVSTRARHFWDPSPLQAMAIVRPASTEEVTRVMRICHAAGQSVVTHGGVTGLADGDRATPEDLVLSLERMHRIERVDDINRTMIVDAGCRLESVQMAAADVDLQFGLDLGARGSCTIGGNLSTNAGGLSVLRYGMAREQVLGLEVVLADGTVLSSMNEMMKNNTGYDLKQLFIGAEGTLGVITRAVLRLRPAMQSVNTALLGFHNFEQVTQLLKHVDAGFAGQLSAFEVLWQQFYRLNTDTTLADSVTSPLSRDFPLYVILEMRGADQDDDTQRFIAVLEDALEKELMDDAALAQSEQERATIWRIRENVDTVRQHDPVFVFDISLPIPTMQDYLDTVQADLEKVFPGHDFFAYGHLADGNLHLQVAPKPHRFGKRISGGPVGTPTGDAEFSSEEIQEWHRQVNQIVFQRLQPLNGSISAEHGIGLSKKPYLQLSRNDVEIGLMKQLKYMLDPTGILNPGKII